MCFLIVVPVCTIREIQAGGVAARFLRMAFDSGGILGELLRCPHGESRVAPDGIPCVGEATRSAKRRRTFAACPDGRVRLLHRLGCERDVGESAVLALEPWLVVRPQLPEGAYVLVADRAALIVRRCADGFKLFAHPTDAAPDNDTPV